MATFREIAVQTEPEDDDIFDLSTTSTLQRGSSTSPTSPGHHSGIFTRVRNSFSSRKVKELKRQVRQYEEEIERLNSLSQSTSQESTDLQLRLTNIVTSNPFNVYISGACRNVQVGGSNTMEINSETETLVADLEELTGKLTLAVQENTQERTSTELKLKNTEILLKEMKELLGICNQSIGQLDKSTSSKIGQVKHLLESLTTDRSDERVITDGINMFRQYVIDRKRMVRTADGLPWNMQIAITRLVNKFGHVTWQEFARIVEVSESSIPASGMNEKEENIDGKTLLDRDMCAKILAQWIIQFSDNDAETLLNMVHSYETRISNEMTETFRKQTVSQSLIPTVALSHEPNQRHSKAYSDTSGGSGSGSTHSARSQLPDERTQFEHHITSWKLQQEMNAKFDTMLKMMQEMKEMKEREVMDAKLADEGHFV